MWSEKETQEDFCRRGQLLYMYVTVGDIVLYP